MVVVKKIVLPVAKTRVTVIMKGLNFVNINVKICREKSKQLRQFVGNVDKNK